MVIMGTTDWDVPGMGIGFLAVEGNQAKLPEIIHGY